MGSFVEWFKVTVQHFSILASLKPTVISLSVSPAYFTGFQFESQGELKVFMHLILQP